MSHFLLLSHILSAFGSRGIMERLQNNDRKTFMLLFEKDFPNMAAARYEQNEDFFVKMFSDPDMMRQVMETVGTVLYEKLRM